MNPTNKIAYKVMRFILENKEFTQRGISEKTGASLGRVNSIVRWMLKQHYIAREGRRYRLATPAALLSLFGLHRRMDDLRMASFSISAEPGDVLRLVKEKGAILCLTSALQEYDSYFRDPSISVYADEKFVKEFKNLPGGYTRITIYRDDIGCPDDITTKKGLKLTTDVRTVIDLFCSNWTYAAEKLVQRKWLRG